MLAVVFRVPHIPSDKLCCELGWIESTHEEFQAKGGLAQSRAGWNTEWDYYQSMGDLVVSTLPTPYVCSVL